MRGIEIEKRKESERGVGGDVGGRERKRSGSCVISKLSRAKRETAAITSRTALLKNSFFSSNTVVQLGRNAAQDKKKKKVFKAKVWRLQEQLFFYHLHEQKKEKKEKPSSNPGRLNPSAL